MPWSIIKKDIGGETQYCIQKDTDKSIVKGSCHTDRADTSRMLAALYANEGKSMEDILIQFGSGIKSLGDGKIGGYLVRYSSKSAPDLAGEFFTKDTDFGFEDTIKTPVYLNHRLPLKAANGKEFVVKQKIGEGVLTKDDDGILIEAILYTRKQYEKVLSMLGWSSGTAAHLVDREKVGKAFHIKHWPLGLDASLTPEPCDPDNVCSLKSLSGAVKFIPVEDDDEDEGIFTEIPVKANSLAVTLARHIEDRVDEGHDRGSIIKSLARESGLEVENVEAILDGSGTASIPNLKAFARVLEVSFDALKSAKQRDYQRTIKGMFEELGESPSRWEMEAKYADVVSGIAGADRTSKLVGVDFDLEGKVSEATEEYAGRLKTHALREIESYISSGSDEPFYLKAIVDLSSDLPVSGHLDLESHSQLAVSALRDVIKRFRANHEARQREGNNLKAGRVLSAANRQRLSTMLEQIQAAVSDCQKLLDESQPMASDSEKRAVLSETLRLQRRARQLGVPAT